jgi:hypothetical protein
MKRVDGEVVGKTVKARPDREGRIRAPRAEKVKDDFCVREKSVPEVVGEVGWVEENREMRWFLAVLTALSAGLVL